MNNIDNKFFPELQFYIYYYELNNNTITIDKKNKIYNKCETLINEEYKKKLDAKKFIDKNSKDNKFSLKNLTNMLYASIGIGILKMACNQKCSPKKKSQSGGAWDDDGNWEGDGEPGLQDFALATYNNVMTTILIPDGLGFRLANEYLHSIPGLPTNEGDDAITRRTKKAINFGAYISFTWSLINLCVYGTYLINIMYTDLLGIKDAGPEIYEFKAPPDPPFLSEGNNDKKSSSTAVIEYKTNDMWSEQLYPKTELIEKIRIIDLILNRGPARDNLQLYLSTVSEEVKDKIVRDVKNNVIDKGNLALEDSKVQLEIINERRENTYDMDSLFGKMRFNLDQMRRYMGVWGPVNDQVTALSRSMDTQQLETEFQLRHFSNQVKYQVEDTVRIHGENIFNAANQVFWSGSVFVGFAVALVTWCIYKKGRRNNNNNEQPQIRIEITAPRRQRSDTRARAQGTLTLTHYFDGENHRWRPIEATRSGEVNYDRDFVVQEAPSSRCPVNCVTFGGKRRKRRKTRRKKRRKTRRKSRRKIKKNRRKTRKKRRKKNKM
tara:strand:+ start:269 stop:1915 length:1647 start_codon:yes stop_codon:yes gene_type:complete